jgi:hypothetical protein
MTIFHTLSSFLAATLVWNVSNARFGYHKSSMRLSFEHIIYPSFHTSPTHLVHTAIIALHIWRNLHYHAASSVFGCAIGVLRSVGRILPASSRIVSPHKLRAGYPKTAAVQDNDHSSSSTFTLLLYRARTIMSGRKYALQISFRGCKARRR